MKTHVGMLKSRVRRDFILESVLYITLWASSIYLVYILQDLILSSLIVGLLAFTGYTYYAKTYGRRKHMLKKLVELKRIDELKGGKNVRFNITFRWFKL